MSSRSAEWGRELPPPSRYPRRHRELLRAIVSGVLGIICLVAGLVFSLIGNVGFDFSGIPGALIGNRLMIVLVAVALSLPLSIWLGKKLFESTLFGGLALNTEEKTDEGFTVAGKRGQSLIGRNGIAATILRPAGKVVVDGRNYDAVAQIGYIEQGQPVTIVDYINGSLVVIKN